MELLESVYTETSSRAGGRFFIYLLYIITYFFLFFRYIFLFFLVAFVVVSVLISFFVDVDLYFAYRLFSVSVAVLELCIEYGCSASHFCDTR